MVPPNFILPILGSFIALGVTLRWPGIERSFGHDELNTILFASQSWSDILSAHDLPNNHFLHTLCVHFMQSVFGDAEWVLRLPALVAGLMGIPVIFWFARRLTGAPTIGLLAALLLTGHALHVSFSQQAQGYTLLVLLGTLYATALWIALTRSLGAARLDSAATRADVTPTQDTTAHDARPGPRSEADWSWIGVAATGSLAILTIPGAALLIGAGTIGAMLLIRRTRGSSVTSTLVALLLATAAIGLHTVLVYLPHLEHLHAHADRFGEPLTLTGFADCVAGVWSAIGPPRLGWLMHVFAAWGLITLEGARRGAGLFLGTLLGLPLVLNLALGIQVEPRVYVYLVPFSLVAIAAGAESLRLLILRRTSDVAWGRWVAAVPLLAVLISFYAK